MHVTGIDEEDENNNLHLYMYFKTKLLYEII